jgi:hypothetical protein
VLVRWAHLNPYCLAWQPTRSERAPRTRRASYTAPK